jgi:phage shock protein PspC (stress-responsive transcriptional regulator)
MNKLYKSRTDRVVAGVAGGLARYLRTDPLLVRLFFVLFALADGIGLLLYVVLAVVMPEASERSGNLPEGEAGIVPETERERNSAVIGGGLVLLGGYLLLRTLAVPFVPWVSLSQLWPFLLIVAGVALLRRQRQNHPAGG